MPVSELEIATALYWLFGIDPSDQRGRDLAEGLDLRKTRDAAHLREVLLGSDAFRRLLAVHPRRSANVPLDLDRPRLAFLHIPKCGGTTLHAILSRHVEPARICPERFNGLRAYRVDDLSTFTMFSGHFDIESCRALVGHDTRIVTLLREPRERLVSLYYFLSIHRPEAEPATAGLVTLARTLPIEDFFRHPSIRRHASIYNAMAAVLIGPQAAVRWEALESQCAASDLVVTDPRRAGRLAVAVLESMTGFGLLERFPESLELLSDDLGLRLVDLPPQQVTDDLRTLGHLDYAERPVVTPALLDILDDLTEADRLLYGQAQALFAARLADLRERQSADVPRAAFGLAEPISLDLFSPREGRREGAAIIASGTAGVLAAGPYITLRHGRYRLNCHFVWSGHDGGSQAFTINVWSNKGAALCETAVWTGASPCAVDFLLAFDVSDLEFVIQLDRDSGFELLAVELARAVAPAEDAP